MRSPVRRFHPRFQESVDGVVHGVSVWVGRVPSLCGR